MSDHLNSFNDYVSNIPIVVTKVVRADLRELWEMDLDGKPYAYTPFCDS